MKAKQITVQIQLSTAYGCKSTMLNGYAFPDSGFLIGDFQPTPSMQTEEVALICAFTYTGCPIVARTPRPVINPWVATGGAYESTRVLSLPTLEVTSKLRSETRGETIHMELDVCTVGVMPPLRNIPLPFQEKIEQRGRGNLEGRFDLDFEDQDGNRVHATAKTEYFLHIDFDAPTVWRNILIVCASNNATHKQIEQIDLFPSQDIADLDLQEKRRVAFAVSGFPKLA